MRVMIQKFLLSTAIVVGSTCAFASDSSTPSNLVEVASHQAALLADSDRPFVMDVDFTVQLDAPVQGHLRLRWEAKDRWWSKASMGQFEQIKFQQGESTFTLRNVDFTPRQVFDLMHLLHVGEGYDKFVTRTEKPRSEGSTRLECLEDPKFKGEHLEICIDATTHDIVSVTRKGPEYTWTVDKTRFSDFVAFGGHRYPRRFECLKEGHLVMSANVVALQESPLDPKLLIPPVGSIERRECPNKTEPQMLNWTDPDYDPRIHGPSETDLQVTILADGSVGDVQTVGVSGREQHAAVMEAFKKWRFKPAMCGTEPVVADTYVTIRFETPNIQ